MKDHLDIIVDKIIQSAEDLNYTTSSHANTVQFKKELKKILLNEFSDLRFDPIETGK